MRAVSPSVRAHVHSMDFTLPAKPFDWQADSGLSPVSKPRTGNPPGSIRLFEGLTVRQKGVELANSPNITDLY